ncbi:MAG: hypothetical protein COB36_14615 [Alphaproteobacteria bacterium]|nr:MAG: hypothetical protein COB36_14615 [Alphaproteobacteria bacterium]
MNNILKDENYNPENANLDVAGQARAWLLRLEMDDMETTDWQDFSDWQSADPAHMKAFEKTERLWGGLGNEAAFSELEDLEPLEQLSWREKLTVWRTGLADKLRWQKPLVWVPAVSVALICMVIISLVLPSSDGLEGLVYETDTGEVRIVSLEDGSIITLGARSRVFTSFSDFERKVTLVQGEVFFNVSKDANRPFVVSSGEAQIRVVGTMFNVNKGRQTTRVDVEEGLVLVLVQRSSKLTIRELDAGKSLTVTQDSPLPEPIVLTLPIGGWREGRLDYFNAELSEVLADVGRYFKGEIITQDKAVAELRLTGTFKTNDINQLFETLAAGLPIVVAREGNDRIILTLRQD